MPEFQGRQWRKEEGEVQWMQCDLFPGLDQSNTLGVHVYKNYMEYLGHKGVRLYFHPRTDVYVVGVPLKVKDLFNLFNVTSTLTVGAYQYFTEYDRGYIKGLGLKGIDQHAKKFEREKKKYHEKYNRIALAKYRMDKLMGVDKPYIDRHLDKCYNTFHKTHHGAPVPPILFSEDELVYLPYLTQQDEDDNINRMMKWLLKPKDGSDEAEHLERLRTIHLRSEFFEYDDVPSIIQLNKKRRVRDIKRDRLRAQANDTQLLEAVKKYLQDARNHATNHENILDFIAKRIRSKTLNVYDHQPTDKHGPLKPGTYLLKRFGRVVHVFYVFRRVEPHYVKSSQLDGTHYIDLHAELQKNHVYYTFDDQPAKKLTKRFLNPYTDKQRDFLDNDSHPFIDTNVEQHEKYNQVHIFQRKVYLYDTMKPSDEPITMQQSHKDITSMGPVFRFKSISRYSLKIIR